MKCEKSVSIFIFNLFLHFIEKLNFIKVENDKILKKLEDISRGKELSVGLQQADSIL